MSTFVLNVLWRLFSTRAYQEAEPFEVLRNATSDEPQFAEHLKGLIRSSPSVLRMYLFRANVGKTSNAFLAGAVFEQDIVPSVMRKINALWLAETGGNRLLGIMALTPEAEQQVSRICAPIFYR